MKASRGGRGRAESLLNASPQLKRLEFPPERVRFDAPEIRNKKIKDQWDLRADLLLCQPQGCNWTWHAAPATRSPSAWRRRWS